MKLYVNRHPNGKLSSFTFGLCSIADGLVRVLTLGWLNSTLALDHSRKAARKGIVRMKKAGGHQ